MTWRAMAPAEACDVMDFWTAAAWPLSRDEVQRLAVERFGWTIEVDDGTPYLMNTVSGFTFPDVSTIGAQKHLSYLDLSMSDTIREVTPESTALLGDAFALMVREGRTRWGSPAMRDHQGVVSATWDVAGGARVRFSLLQKSLSAMFETPQGVAVERKLGY